MRRLVIVIKRHRIFGRLEVKAGHGREFVVVFENARREILLGLVNGCGKQSADFIHFLLRHVAFWFGAALVGIDHCRRNHHRQARKVVNQHLLYDDDVRDVPDQIVVEAVRNPVELFQSVIVEELRDDVAARSCDGKSVSHFFKISDKSKQFDIEMDFLCNRKID
jgi:hypothetical protein